MCTKANFTAEPNDLDPGTNTCVCRLYLDLQTGDCLLDGCSEGTILNIDPDTGFRSCVAPVKAVRFVFGAGKIVKSASLAEDPARRLSDSAECPTNYVDSDGGVIITGASSWNDAEHPVLYYQRGAFFDTYTYYIVSGLMIPYAGSFQMQFWFKMDSRHSQCLFSSSNIDRPSINHSKSHTTFFTEVDSWALELRGLRKIWRMADHTNIRSGRG
jgi:hypothetical protein